MPPDPGAASRVLIAAHDPPRQLDRYRTARDDRELEETLRANADSLALAVIFTDFELKPERAEAISASLPYVLIDRWRSGEQRTASAGVGALLASLTYFDRLAVMRRSRWEQWSTEYGLPPVNLAPPADTDRTGGLEAAILRDASVVPEDHDRRLQTEPAGRADPEFRLRHVKQMHLAELATVNRALRSLTRRMQHPERLRLLEFNPGSGRWCHSLGQRLIYSAASSDESQLHRLQEDFPDRRFLQLPTLLAAERQDFDLLLAVDAVNVGDDLDQVQLDQLLSLARDGTRLMLIERFGPDGTPGHRATIREFEERLWAASRGQLLLEASEIVRYPFRGSPRNRALLKLRWLG